MIVSVTTRIFADDCTGTPVFTFNGPPYNDASGHTFVSGGTYANPVIDFDAVGAADPDGNCSYCVNQVVHYDDCDIETETIATGSPNTVLTCGGELLTCGGECLTC